MTSSINSSKGSTVDQNEPPRAPLMAENQALQRRLRLMETRYANLRIINQAEARQRIAAEEEIQRLRDENRRLRRECDEKDAQIDSFMHPDSSEASMGHSSDTYEDMATDNDSEDDSNAKPDD